MNDIIKIVQDLEDCNTLLKGITKTIKNETKEQRGRLLSDKFKHNNKGTKYFIGYEDNDIIRSLCIVLPEMSGYIKYFDNG